MSELITNRLWNAGVQDGPSQYARMIPGVSDMARPKISAAATAENYTLPHPANVFDATAKSARAQAAPRQPRPQLSGDQFRLFQAVAADFIVLVVVCGALSLFVPAWGLPWSSLPIFAVLLILSGFCEGLYSQVADSPLSVVAPVLVRSTVLAVALVFIAAWDQMRHLAAITIFASSVSGLMLWRWLRWFLAVRSRREMGLRKVLIVGGGPIALSIARTLRNDPLRRATVCGFVDDELPISPTVLGRIADLDWLARGEFIEEVILALPGQPDQAREAAEIAFRNHLDIRAVPDLPVGPWCDSGVDHIGEIPVVTLHCEPLPSAGLFLKRLLDIGGAAIGLVLASPLMAVIALLIRLDSPGLVVYSAERTGVKGRRFRCYKFRSMVTNAESLKEELRNRNQREGPIFKIDDDPRITRVGRILRRYSLDELPQLWNVLRGEMSLVGPRPHPVDEVNHYELNHYRRLDMKPGVTGLWQITARDCPSFELNMHLDLTYIENWSLRLDLRILASTARVLFAPEGA